MPFILWQDKINHSEKNILAIHDFILPKYIFVFIYHFEKSLSFSLLSIHTACSDFKSQCQKHPHDTPQSQYKEKKFFQGDYTYIKKNTSTNI